MVRDTGRRRIGSAPSHSVEIARCAGRRCGAGLADLLLSHDLVHVGQPDMQPTGCIVTDRVISDELITFSGIIVPLRTSWGRW